MGREIERKFLVLAEAWHPGPATGQRFRQGYLSNDPARVVRVRVADDHAFLTIKGATMGIERLEFEYPIPVADAESLLALCLHPLIEKVRYRCDWQGHTWEVDLFEGENAGLVVAEIELAAVDTPFTSPPWLGREVSGDPRYYNAALIEHPFSRWGHQG